MLCMTYSGIGQLASLRTESRSFLDHCTVFCSRGATVRVGSVCTSMGGAGGPGSVSASTLGAMDGGGADRALARTLPTRTCACFLRLLHREAQHTGKGTITQLGQLMMDASLQRLAKSEKKEACTVHHRVAVRAAMGVCVQCGDATAPGDCACAQSSGNDRPPTLASSELRLPRRKWQTLFRNVCNCLR